MHKEVIEVLEKDILTEDNTDRLIDILVSMMPLPLWMKWLPLRAVLDRLLPGVLIKALHRLVDETSEN